MVFNWFSTCLQIEEFSRAWETGLTQVCGVIPPRTHVNPFIAKPHPLLADREVPVYQSGAFLSQIVPGGKLDPYANPLPSEEQFAKERARLVREGKITPEQISYMQEEIAFNKVDHENAVANRTFELRHVYRAAPMAEYYRIKAYQKLHPELELDEEKFKSKINLDKLKYSY